VNHLASVGANKIGIFILHDAGAQAMKYIMVTPMQDTGSG